MIAKITGSFLCECGKAMLPIFSLGEGFTAIQCSNTQCPNYMKKYQLPEVTLHEIPEKPIKAKIKK